METPNRRRVLEVTGGVAFTRLAGCVSLPGGETGGGGVGDGGDTGAENGDSSTDSETESDDKVATGPPTADRRLPESYTVEELHEQSQSGGPPPDGIPAIDEPTYRNADDPPANLAADSPVFGVEIDGDVRAFPQYNLVWHEIVNAVIGGESVAVTYCLLTGTAQGFYRGDTTFGVSGQLVNTNLIMFDRATETYWPQVPARGITGPHAGEYLTEFRVVWTTWERWRSAHPETKILSEDTGFPRDYGSDPYGDYRSQSGYYVTANTIFPLLERDDRFHLKDVVIGARTHDGALAVEKDHLRDASVVEGTVDDADYLTVYDAELDTGYVYRNPDDEDVAREGDRYAVGGDTHDPGDLPLDREIAFDAMWLAWYGFYPTTVVHE